MVLLGSFPNTWKHIAGEMQTNPTTAALGHAIKLAQGGPITSAKSLVRRSVMIVVLIMMRRRWRRIVVAVMMWASGQPNHRNTCQ